MRNARYERVPICAYIRVSALCFCLIYFDICVVFEVADYKSEIEI